MRHLRLWLVAAGALALTGAAGALPEPRKLWSIPASLRAGTPASEWDHERMQLDPDGDLWTYVADPAAESDTEVAGELQQLDGRTGALLSRYTDGGFGLDVGTDGIARVWGETADYVIVDGILTLGKPPPPGHDYVQWLRHGRYLELYPAVRCYAPDGRLLWQRPAPVPRYMGGNETWSCYEDLVDDVVYLLYGAEQLVALDAATGEVRWHGFTQLIRYHLLPGGGALLLQGQRARAMATDGRVLWEYLGDEPLTDARIWSDGIYLTGDAELHALDPAGNPRWRRPVTGWPWVCGPDGACSRERDDGGSVERRWICRSGGAGCCGPSTLALAAGA